jgi:hypothetical protein
MHVSFSGVTGYSGFMSIMSTSAVTGYSARVRLELQVGSVCYPLAQMGNDRLIFDRNVQLPGTSGELRAWIDNHEKRWLATWEASDVPRRIVWATFEPVV